MKKIVLYILLTAFSLQALPQESGTGIGVILGNPTGISTKMWLGENSALGAHFGYHFGPIRNLYLGIDYLIHPWSFSFYQDEIRIYCGPGLGLGFTSDFSISLRAPGGVSYNFHQLPLEAYAEAVPGLQLTGMGGIRILAGVYVGIRWYFD